jgi:hypothetical protein
VNKQKKCRQKKKQHQRRSLLFFSYSRPLLFQKKIFQKYVYEYISICDYKRWKWKHPKVLLFVFRDKLASEQWEKRYEFMNENQNWGEHVRDRNMRPSIMIMNSSSNYVYTHIYINNFYFSLLSAKESTN